MFACLRMIGLPRRIARFLAVLMAAVCLGAPAAAQGPLQIDGSQLHEGARDAHVPEYRVRVDDVVELLYELRREGIGARYRLAVGDSIRIQSATVPALNRTLVVEPDGYVTAPIVGRVSANSKTVSELRDDLMQAASASVRESELFVTPEKLYTELNEFQSSFSGFQTHGELVYPARVSPDGTLQLPALETLPAAGLTLSEIEREAEARYDQRQLSCNITARLRQRAPSYITILGEVRFPSRVPLTTPVSVTNAIAIGGGWINGANLKNVVVLRRDDNWRLLATSLDLRDSLNAKSTVNAHEIWLRDGDTVIVPKTKLRRLDDAILLAFTNGLYRTVPIDGGVNYLRIDGQQQFIPGVIGAQTSAANSP
jgi:polysaccharide export outer membrane protein